MRQVASSLAVAAVLAADLVSGSPAAVPAPVKVEPCKQVADAYANANGCKYSKVSRQYYVLGCR